MVSIEEAMTAAEERKNAVFGDPGGNVVTPTAFQRRAVFSGLDVDPGDLDEFSKRAGYWMAQHTAHSDMSLQEAFTTMWADAFLTGIMHAHCVRKEINGLQS